MSYFERLKEDVLSFREKGKVVLLGDFNARVGKVADDDDVIGKFREDSCNAKGYPCCIKWNWLHIIADS